MRYAVLLILAATIAAPASAAFLGGTVDAPAAGPGTGLRYAERIHVGDGWEETTRIVTVGDPDTVRDARGAEGDAVPVTVQRRADGEVLAAERCWAAADAPTALQREPLTPASPDPLLERAWRRSGDAVPDAWDRAEAPWPNDTVAATFGGDPCPARGPGTTLDLERPGSIPLEGLLPAGLPTPAEAEVQGDIHLADGTFHGRPARWVNATFHLRLPGPLPGPGDDVAPGPLRVEGRTASLWTDDLPGPVRRTVSLSLHAPDAPAYDRELAWETELTGHEPGPTAELGPATPTSDPVASAPWTDRGPSTTGYDVSFPLEEAVAALETTGARYKAYALQHPEAYVRSATYDTGVNPGPVDQVPGPASVHNPAWTVGFVSPSGDAYRGTVVETDGGDPPSWGGGDDGGSSSGGGPNASSTALAWESPADASTSEAGPAADLDRLDPVASGDEIRRAVDGLGFPGGPLTRLGLRVHAPQAGAGVEATVELAATYRTPAGAVPETVRALVDGETGRVLAITESSPDEGASSLPEPVPRTFSGSEAGARSGAAASLPDGPSAGLGLAAGASLLGLLVGVKLLSPLFTRIGRDEVLENPVRRTLLEAIEEEPGIHLAELIERAGVGNGATRHHLGKLVDADLVQVIRHGGYRRFFPAGVFTEAEARQRAVLRSGSNREVYEAYRDEPDQSVRALAERLGMGKSAVHRALTMLREVGLVDD